MVNWVFSDSFDPYNVTADAVAGYWDSGSTITWSLFAGRFSGGQAAGVSAATGAVWLVKSSNSNDNIHHINLAFRQTAVLSGTNLGLYLTLGDGTTAQCSIVFRSDGVILLTSGLPGGTVLATYAGAVPAQNLWFSFEFEVVIHNTAGSFSVRRNARSSNDFSASSLNTRPGTNAYANRLSVGHNIFVNSQMIDDLLWRSDATSVPWVGDIRCYLRVPNNDVAVQFAKGTSSINQIYVNSITYSAGPVANQIWSVPIVAGITGHVTSLVAYFTSALTGHANMAVYDNSGPPGLSPANNGSPGALLAQSTQLTNPGTSVQVFTLATPLPIVRGTQYWIAMFGDAAFNIAGFSAYACSQFNAAYSAGAFPSAINSAQLSSTHNGFGYIGWNVTPDNAQLVSEVPQDTNTTLVFDAAPGHADFYNLVALPAPFPGSVIATTIRGFAAKSDAGARSGALQLKSGSTTAASPTTLLSTSFSWLWRTDQVDPATGAAWTAAAVDALQIGPTVIA